MQLIRKDSTYVTAYNDGLLVFLYDEANAEMINAANPSILVGFGDEDAEDPILGDLATQGALAVYELEGDGELAIEISVGEPLSDEELAGGRWRRTQRARLVLPSGALRVESYNNLALGPEATRDEPGASITVPPGDYLLSLHRPDRLDIEEDEPKSPWQVITLTPQAHSDVVLEGPMLRYPQ